MPEAKEKGLWEALQRFQETCPPIGFDNEGQVGTRTYGYATLPAILRITRPVLRECGLVVTQKNVGRVIETTIYHLPSGEFSVSRLDLTEVADMQKLGSAMTYGRRYDYCVSLGLAPDEDDDGAATVSTSTPPFGPRPKVQTPAPPTPEGWGSSEEAVEAHNELAGRIGVLPQNYKDQMVAFREENGWPLAKDKFLDLAALVLTAENFVPDGA